MTIYRQSHVVQQAFCGGMNVHIFAFGYLCTEARLAASKREPMITPALGVGIGLACQSRICQSPTHTTLVYS